MELKYNQLADKQLLFYEGSSHVVFTALLLTVDNFSA